MSKEMLEKWVLRGLWLGVAIAMFAGWNAEVDSTGERVSWAVLVFTVGWAAGGSFALGRWR